MFGPLAPHHEPIDLVLQARDRRSYLLLTAPDAIEVRGREQSHGWWVNQVSSGAAKPLATGIQARPGHRLLVLRGGEEALAAYAYRYLPADEVEPEQQRLAEEALTTARAALRRKNAVVARILTRQGLRAWPAPPSLVFCSTRYKYLHSPLNKIF